MKQEYLASWNEQRRQRIVPFTAIGVVAFAMIGSTILIGNLLIDSSPDPIPTVEPNYNGSEALCNYIVTIDDPQTGITTTLMGQLPLNELGGCDCPEVQGQVMTSCRNIEVTKE